MKMPSEWHQTPERPFPGVRFRTLVGAMVMIWGLDPVGGNPPAPYLAAIFNPVLSGVVLSHQIDCWSMRGDGDDSTVLMALFSKR